MLTMRHGFRRTFQSAFGQLDEGLEAAHHAGAEEMRKAGAIMEVVNGVALSRFAETGFEALAGKDRQLAMIGGLQDKRIRINGNPLFLLWFQSLAKLLTAKN